MFKKHFGRRVVSIVLSVVMLMSLLPMSAISASAETLESLTVTIDTGDEVTLGDSDGNGYYDIGTADELYAFAAAVNSYGYTTINAELTDDIVVNEGVLNEDYSLVENENYRLWTPIGTEDSVPTVKFNGNNHTISGLYVSGEFIGFFQIVDANSEIKNLGIIDSYYYSNRGAGAVIAFCLGTVENCYSSSYVYGKYANSSGTTVGVGGVVGTIYGGTVKNCYNTGFVDGYECIGGVVGYVTSGATVENCYNTGAVGHVDVNDDYSTGGAGGVVCTIEEGTVKGCYNTGTVSTRASSCGIVNESVYGVIQYCYNSGMIIAESGGYASYEAGIVGMQQYGLVDSCYSIGTLSGATFVSAGISCICLGGTVSNCYSTDNVSTEAEWGYGSIVGYPYTGEEVIENNYYLDTVGAGGVYGQEFEGMAEAKTAEQFASGEVAYLLQGEQEEQIWGQNIDNGAEEQITPVLAGAKVYFGYNYCADDYTGTYSNYDTEDLLDTKPDHNFVDGKCTVCGKSLVEDGVAGYTLTLGDKIAISYWMTLTDDTLADENAKMVFTVPDTGSSYTVEIPVSEAVENGTYYVFTCEVAAKEMASAIKSKLVRSDSELEFADYAIVDYAEGILADTTTYADEQDIVKAMLNYGAYSQVYFGYNTDNLANAILADDDKVLVETLDLSSYAYTVSGEETGVEFYGCIPSLKSETALKLYFDIDSSVDVESLTFTVNGTDVTPVKNGSYYEVKISGIAAHQLANTYTVTVGDLTVEYGVFSYGKIAMSTSKTALKDVVKAMYAYSQAADDYSDSWEDDGGRE